MVVDAASPRVGLKPFPDHYQDFRSVPILFALFLSYAPYTISRNLVAHTDTSFGNSAENLPGWGSMLSSKESINLSNSQTLTSFVS